ncbi:3124_t:CDS:1 [Entrophospora sp. SA101]|nr:3124_t:CDS:1 [Entrophospora sp. SA101]
MSKALAVQSTNCLHTSVKLNQRPTSSLKQVSIVSTTNPIVNNIMSPSHHHNYPKHHPQQQAPCKHAESSKQQQQHMMPTTHHTKAKLFDYEALYSDELNKKHQDKSYRYFNNSNRLAKHFPKAHTANTNEKVTVWCSNDYLGMGRNPVVLESMQ